MDAGRLKDCDSPEVDVGVGSGSSGRRGHPDADADRQRGGSEDFAANGKKNRGDDESCCMRVDVGIRLSPFILLLLFIYVNLLNYVDRGLVAGVLPTYCVSCPSLMNNTECGGHRSCEWETVVRIVPCSSRCLFFLLSFR